MQLELIDAHACKPSAGQLCNLTVSLVQYREPLKESKTFQKLGETGRL